MNPEEYFDSENVFTSSGRHIPEVLVKKAAKIYKQICDIVEGDAESDIVDSGQFPVAFPALKFPYRITGFIVRYPPVKRRLLVALNLAGFIFIPLLF